MSGTKSTTESSDRASKHRGSVVNHIGLIFVKYGEEYIKQYRPSLRKIKLIRAMRVCKSPALGGRVILCKICQNKHYIYHSCGHSHCPICHCIKREQWADKLKKEMLNVAYIHMIFTLPQELRGLVRANKKVLYNLLLKTSWAVVNTLSSIESNIGGLPGMISVLHTFGSDMKYHVHTHNLVTFGGLDTETGKWKSPNRDDRIAKYGEINSTFRALFLVRLKSLYASGEISYHRTYAELEIDVKHINWVVHNTKPTINTGVLEEYLARYINRIAISNSKVEWLASQSKVKLVYNDYRNQKEGEAAPKETKLLDPLVFIDQFLQHVLPPYFHKTRRCGLHSSATKNKYKTLLPENIQREGAVVRTVMQILKHMLKQNPYVCEKCESEEFEIQIERPDKEWIHQYINVPKRKPTGRSPPKGYTRYERLVTEY